VGEDKKCPYDNAARLFKKGGSAAEEGDNTIYTDETCKQKCVETAECHFFTVGIDPGNGAEYGLCMGCKESATLEGDLGFSSYELGDSCWADSFVCQNTATGKWGDHETIAKGDGGEMLAVTSEEMQDYIRDSSNFDTSADYYIGFTDDGTEGTWLWSDGSLGTFVNGGTSSTYTNWASGEPGNDPSDDCAYIKQANGEWDDEQCNSFTVGAFYSFPRDRYQDVCGEYTCQPGPGNDDFDVCNS